VVYGSDDILLVSIIINHAIPRLLVGEDQLVHERLEHVQNKLDLFMIFLRFISIPFETFKFFEQALGAHELVLGLDPLLRRVIEIVIYEVSYLINLIEIVLFFHTGAFARQKLIVGDLRHIDL